MALSTRGRQTVRGKDASTSRSTRSSTLDLIKGPQKTSAQTALEEVKKLLKQMRHQPRTENEVTVSPYLLPWQLICESVMLIEKERPPIRRKKN